MSREELTSKAIRAVAHTRDFGQMAEHALAAADAHDAAHGIHRVTIDDGTVLRAAHALYDHREDALTCYDHNDGWCCVCGEHEIEIPWFEHAARSVLAAAVEAGQ